LREISLQTRENASETRKMLKTAFGDNAVGRTRTFEWFSRLKRGETSVNIKSMLVIFFDCEGTVHQEFVPPGQTMNQNYYLEVLKRLREHVHRKRPERWRNQDWFLRHDNAPAHNALSVQRFLAAKNMAVVPHAPYPPDLAPCDFFLFPRMKSKLKGCRFQDVTEIQEQIVDRRTRDSKKSVLAVLPAAAETLDPLHKLGRGIQ
jgi:hypothetical protein